MPQPPTESHDDAAPPLRTLPWPVRWLLLAFAVMCLVMGIIGVIVPGLPTTVFILMAAWAAARSSPGYTVGCGTTACSAPASQLGPRRQGQPTGQVERHTAHGA